MLLATSLSQSDDRDVTLVKLVELARCVSGDPKSILGAVPLIDRSIEIFLAVIYVNLIDRSIVVCVVEM